jgi:hypothetical protein
MTIEQLIGKLLEVEVLYGRGGQDDPEVAHSKMDDLLIEYINDKRVTEIWERQTRWYA